MSANQQLLSMHCKAFLERIPDNLLLNPVDYIFADHCRQSFLCKTLHMIARDNTGSLPSSDIASSVLQYLNIDLPLHIQDEECDLLPRMLVHSDPTDHFSDVLNLMASEHKRDRELAQRLQSELTLIAGGTSPKDIETFRDTCEAFVTMHLSHLNWENTMILPQARNRLDAQDFSSIGRAMAARRSIPYPDGE